MVSQDRLLPSLLDRLTDEEPDKRTEPRENRALSARAYREALKRDVGWLLNTTNLGAVQDLSIFPWVGQSVVNYGIPDLTGKTVSGLGAEPIQRLIRKAILDFEPRILRDSLRVRVLVAREEMGHNALRFEIEGDLWSQPAPVRMLLQSEIDLDTGHVKVEETSARGTA